VSVGRGLLAGVRLYTDATTVFGTVSNSDREQGPAATGDYPGGTGSIFIGGQWETSVTQAVMMWDCAFHVYV
jgi:hypothetical protein